MTTVRQIESIAPLPDNQGYEVIFTTAFEAGILRAHDRIQGLHYKQQKPQIKFGIRFNAQEDPYRLRFVCDCSDDQLVRSELLALLKAIHLAPEGLAELPISPTDGPPASLTGPWTRT